MDGWISFAYSRTFPDRPLRLPPLSPLTGLSAFVRSPPSQAYTRVAPFVGGFPEYRRALADHLVHTKLKHWEKSLREVRASGR